MQKLHKLRRMLAALLVVALVFAMSPVAYARETDFFEPLELVAGDYDMADFDAVQPNADTFDEYRRRVLLSNGIKHRDELIKALIGFNEAYQQLHAAESLAMYRYYCEPVDYADTYRAWQELITRVERDYQETWRELAASDNREMIEELVSPVILAQYDGSVQVDDALLAKRQQVQGLAADYWQAIDEDYRVTYGGKSYGFADLAAIEDNETYNAVYKLLAKARNAGVAGLLADVIPVANDYAKALGYDGYADYAYAAVYGRDYTPEQAAKLHTLVKQYIVPLYTKLLAAEANPLFDWDELSAVGDFSGDELLGLLAEYLPEISDEYAAALEYMQQHHLADVEPDDGKLSASFTSYISYLRIALLFIGSHSGTAHDLSTLVHEFGHFAYYMYEQRDTGYDVGEFHSQGLEMLFLHFADDIFGEAAAAHRLNELTLQVRAVVDGCLYDEFQQRAYALKKPTVSELNRLFHELSVEYGYAYLHDDDEAYNWVTTAHTFIQPFYYMSYAVSGLSALELLGESDDFAAACDSYLTMATLGVNGYRAFAKKAGLADIFTESGMRTIANGLESYFYEDICGLTDMDELSNHWAKDTLLSAVRVGLLAGDEAGRVQPNAAVSRAEAVVLLWRANGEPAGEGSFADVSSGAWYAGAAAWAKDSGISRGSDGGRFLPQDELTREELVVLLYRLNGNNADVDTAVLGGYYDVAAISDWAREAFAWAVSEGVVSGFADGGLHPQDTATRAETVTLIWNAA